MKKSEKMELINKIASELQDRYTYREIDIYLAEFEISPPQNVEVNSKRIYAGVALGGTSDSLVIQIANDLGLISSKGLASGLPQVWADDNSVFKLFISHVATEKTKATRLKECLKDYGVKGFVAHEDIEPTLEWQSEIEKALQTMDAMVTIHTEGFKDKYWCQQEVGFALGKDTKIISLRMGEDPVGFISKHQALSRGKKTAEVIAPEIITLLESDDRTKDKIFAAKPNKNPFDLDDEIPF